MEWYRNQHLQRDRMQPTIRYDMVQLDYRIPGLPSRVESVSDELGLTEMISASENKNVVVIYLRCKGCSRF